LTGNEPVSMSVETVRECIRRLDRFGRVWASFLCVSCVVHLLSCRLVDPELSAFEAMDPCCGAGIHLVLFSANGYGLTVVLLMRCCLCQHKRQDWFCFELPSSPFGSAGTFNQPTQTAYSSRSTSCRPPPSCRRSGALSTSCGRSRSQCRMLCGSRLYCRTNR
jgi:hypothetical protein